MEDQNLPLFAFNDQEKAYVDSLVSLCGNEGVWPAVRWFASRMGSRVSNAQLDLPVHTPEGQAAYFVAKGRRIGHYDLIDTVEAERQRRADLNKSQVTDLT